MIIWKIISWDLKTDRIYVLQMKKKSYENEKVFFLFKMVLGLFSAL